MEFVLLERGADINSRDNAGNTPMHIAAANNNMNSIMFLLSDIGADITIQNNYGETARDLAAEYEEGQDIVDLLEDMLIPFVGDVYGIEHEYIWMQSQKPSLRGTKQS